MDESSAAFEKFIDDEFFKLGSFYCDFEGEQVILGKGGRTKNTDAIEVTDDLVFHLKHFYLDTYLSYFPENILKTSRSAIKSYLQSWKMTIISPTKTTNTDHLYESDFHRLKAAFAEGLQKVVLVSREEYGNLDSLMTRRQLFKRSFEFGSGLPYGIWDESSGVIGSSPELLFSINGSSLLSFALAGTCRTGQEEQLLSSPKDRIEHNLVIKDISQKLTEFASSIQAEETVLFTYKEMVHLMTKITACLNNDFILNTLVKKLSPTAALGGYPQHLGMKFLKSSVYYKQFPDRYFGSAFGVVSKAHLEFLVSIRNVQWNRENLFIESGGGVLPQSELSQEMKEILLKRESIREYYL